MKALHFIRYAALAATLGGCQGVISEQDEPTCESTGDCIVDPEPLAAEVAPTALRRLSRPQYIASVRAIFGVEFDLNPNDLPADATVRSLFPYQPLAPSPVDTASVYAAVANQLAVEIAPVVDERLTCDRSEPGACGREIMYAYGRLTFRRPPTESEIETYGELFDWSLEDGSDSVGATELMISALLQSADFLYLLEDGVADASLPLNAYALATRLAFFLWASPPDDWLLDAARDGLLDDAEGVEAIARDMVEDPRTLETVAAFHRYWLGIDNAELPMGDATDALSSEVRETLPFDMRGATDAHIRRIFFDNPLLADFLRASATVENERLAAHLGVSVGEVSPSDYGLLTHPSVIANHSQGNIVRPIHRGLFVRETLLCRTPQAAPPIPTFDPEPAEGQTARQALESLTTSAPDCARCHAEINPLGYAFEHFDSLGRYRTEDEQGLPLEAHGTLNIDGSRVEFEGPEDFMAAINTSTELAECVARQWFRYGLGRIDSPEEEPYLDDIVGVFGAAEFDVRELLVAIAGSDAFRFRRPTTGEEPATAGSAEVDPEDS